MHLFLLLFFFSKFGVRLLAPETAGWFPAEELRSFYEVKEHTLTKPEKVLFGMREDGSEGVLFPTKPM